MKRSVQILLAILVWIVSEAVLQYHGLCFWNEHGGWWWSIALGVLTLWFWMHHRRVVRWTFGVLASVLLMLGPLWQVGAPLADQMEQRDAYLLSVSVETQALKATEAELVDQLNSALRKSEKRTGWKGSIDGARADLDSTRARLVELASSSPAGSSWLSVSVIVIQLAALLVLQVASIAALFVLRGVSEDDEDEDDSVPEAVPVAVLQERIQNRHGEQRRTVLADKNAVVKNRIIEGKYGEEPVVRQVMAGENIGHERARVIFGDLVDTGKMRRVGDGFRLVHNEA